MVMEKILFVDDEISILDGMKRNLRKKYKVHVADGGEPALDLLHNEGPFSVVVSDMRMPGMDGAQFLAAVKNYWPDTTRILLTGQADMDSAISAVNEGNIFRFLTKPCPQDDLCRMIDAGIEQHHLIQVEKELLEDTLRGSINVLVDLLALTNPVAFSKAMRIKRYTQQVVSIIGIKDVWQYEIAALLSQIGCVTVPADTLEKAVAGEELSDTEREMLNSHPQIGEGLIKSIPRLEKIAAMIGNQGQRLDQYDKDELQGKPSPQVLGALILKTVSDFDALLETGISPKAALREMKNDNAAYGDSLLETLSEVKPPDYEKTIQSIEVVKLRDGMLLAEEVRHIKGMLIVAKGQEVNSTLRRCLQNFYNQKAIAGTVRVHVIHEKGI